MDGSASQVLVRAGRDRSRSRGLVAVVVATLLVASGAVARVVGGDPDAASPTSVRASQQAGDGASGEAAERAAGERWAPPGREAARPDRRPVTVRPTGAPTGTPTGTSPVLAGGPGGAGGRTVAPATATAATDHVGAPGPYRPLRPGRPGRPGGGPVPAPPSAVPAPPSAVPAPPAAVPGEASAVVGPSGGTVRLPGSSGSAAPAAVLRVPAGALDAPVLISVRATSEFSGPELLSSRTAGVELRPSGLRFAEPAVLDLSVPGGADPGPLLAVLWEEDPGTAEPVPWRAGPGGTVRIDVPHFSGAGVGVPVVLGCSSLSLVDPVANQYKLVVGAYADQLGAGADPAGVEASLLATLESWRGTAVAPAVVAADSPAEFRQAAQRVLDWWQMVQCLGLVEETQTAREALTTSLRETGVALAERYLLPACTALASDIRDWVRVPLSITADLQLLGEQPSPRMAAMLGPAPAGGPAHGPFCLRAVVHETEAPDVLDIEDRYVEVTFAARLEVVAQGGSLTAGPQRTDLGPFAFEATVTGGTVDGATEVQGTTDAVGRRTFTVDRGADEADRDPQVTIAVDLVRALPGVVPPSLADQDGPDRAVTTALRLDLRPEPSLRVVVSPNAAGSLGAGASREVCVTVIDEVDDPVGGAAVAFGFDGPVSPASASGTTVDNGVACATFTSPDDLDEPSTVTVGVVATKDDVTSPTATLVVPLAPAEQPQPPAPPVAPALPPYRGGLVYEEDFQQDRTDGFGVRTQSSSSTRRSLVFEESNGYRGTALWTLSATSTVQRGPCVTVTTNELDATGTSMGRQVLSPDQVLLFSQVRGSSVVTRTTTGPPSCTEGGPASETSSQPVDWRMSFLTRPERDDDGRVVRYVPVEAGVEGAIVDVRFTP